MDRMSTDIGPDHSLRAGSNLGMMVRGPEGMKNPADPFSQPLDSMMRKPPGMMDQGRGDDFGMVDPKKLGMSADKMPKPMFAQGPPGQVMPGKRMGGPDDKIGDPDNLKGLDFVNPLLYKPASKPPVIKEGDWLCPDPTRPNLNKIKNKTYMLSKLYEENNWSCPNCKNINKGERKRCHNCNESKPNDIEEELKNTKADQGMDGDMMESHADFGDDYASEARYGRPGGMRGRGGGNFKSGFGGGRGGSGGGRGGRGGGGNRGPPNRAPPMRRGGGYQGGGNRYGPPGGYDGGMGPAPYMDDFGRDVPPRGMMRGRSNFPPMPQQRMPSRGNYMDDPFDDDMGGAGRQNPSYGENYRERSRSQEKNHEGPGAMN